MLERPSPSRKARELVPWLMSYGEKIAGTFAVSQLRDPLACDGVYRHPDQDSWYRPSFLAVRIDRPRDAILVHGVDPNGESGRL